MPSMRVIQCFSCLRPMDNPGPLSPCVCTECWQKMTPAERCERWEAIAQKVAFAQMEASHADLADILVLISTILERLARTEQAINVNANNLAKPLEAFGSLMQFILNTFTDIDDPLDRERIAKAKTWIERYLDGGSHN